MHTPELLAPAGSKEAVIAAIENGADAVYFGGGAFGARHEAGLSQDELEWAIDYAHINNVKAYITVNTLIKESELEKVCSYLQFLCNAGADAVLVQDIGILGLLRDQLPQLPVHVSTQMTIYNEEGVRFLEDRGVKRVVLARELSLDEIRTIRSRTNTEIEVFIHGALCFSYSGQCLLSSMIGGRSGNRGYCAQPCRRKYAIDGANGHLLSPRDLNMSEHVGDLIESGIDSFKIEGRLKRPEYVAGVVRMYRQLIDRYRENPADYHVSDEEKHNLRQLFNRGFTKGYFFGNPGGNLMSRKQPHNHGTFLGTVVKYDREKKFAYIHIEQPLRIGDGIGTEGRATGTTVRSMYIDNVSVEHTPSCAIVKIPMEKMVYRNESVFKTYDARLMESLKMNHVTTKIPITISYTAKHGEPATLCMADGEHRVVVKGEIPAEANGSPLSEEAIIRQLKKLGTTIFEPAAINIDLDDDIFIPISQLNSLRRSAAAKFEQKRTRSWKRNCKKPEIVHSSVKREPDLLLAVNTCTIEAFEAAVDGGADVVYFGGENLRNPLTKDDYQYAMAYGRERGVKVYLGIPRIARNLEELVSLNPDGFLVANPGALYSLKKIRDKRSLIIDYPFNAVNRLTMEHLLDDCQRVTLSPELTLDEIRHIAPHGHAECIVHGYFPLMVSEHDLLGGLFPDEKRRKALLEDEKHFTFPIMIDDKKRTLIMNSRELCMLNYIPHLINAGVSCLRIEARTYDRKTAGKITQVYRRAVDNGTTGKCSGGTTTGHYFRGVA